MVLSILFDTTNSSGQNFQTRSSSTVKMIYCSMPDFIVFSNSEISAIEMFTIILLSITRISGPMILGVAYTDIETVRDKQRAIRQMYALVLIWFLQ